MGRKFFNDILTQVNFQEFFGTKYYNIKDIICVLSNSFEEIIIDEIILLPFYKSPISTLELYDYELNVNYEDFTQFILKKCGKSDIINIPLDIYEKNKNCYIQITKNYLNNKLLLIKYFEYIINNRDIFNRVKNHLHENFNDNYLCCEFY